MTENRLVKLVMLEVHTSAMNPFEGNPLEEVLSAVEEHKPDILVGPEFLFYSSPIYTRRERRKIHKKIAKVSEGRLILPGTFIWQKGINIPL